MGKLRDGIDEVESAWQRLKQLRAWTSVKWPRALGVVFVIALACLGAFWYAVYEFDSTSQKMLEIHREEQEVLVAKIQHQNAYDQIVTCLEAKKSQDKLQEWYCAEATRAYELQTGQTLPPGRKEQVIREGAVLAMRDDVAHQIRFLEHNVISQRQQLAIEDLKIRVFAPLIFYPGFAAILVALVALYWFLRTPPVRLKTDKTEEPDPKTTASPAPPGSPPGASCRPPPSSAVPSPSPD